MRFNKWCLFFSVLLSLSSVLLINGQSGYKAEMRGAWVATVANIDWPSSRGLDDASLKKEIDNIVFSLYELGFNALFVQVRPSYGTLYPSNIEPWSKYLQGDRIHPYTFDPLAYWIQACKEKGMEFHAWLNPYRVLASPSPQEERYFLSKQAYPHLYVKYGKNLYFDPAYPENREYIVNLIKEIVENYEVDGIHFDDYFYPYKEAGKEYDDSHSYHLYKGNYTDKGDWRRHNTSLLIQSVSKYLSSAAPYLRFGISPFGVWRNKEVDQAGSDTRAGVTSYDDLYADILHWAREGWIDYVAPQIYWHIGFSVADYETLVNWWNLHVKDCDIFVGHAVYKLDGASPHAAWRSPNEIRKQVELNRNFPNIQGSIFYNTSSILKNPLDVRDVWRNSLYTLRVPTPRKSDFVGEMKVLYEPRWDELLYFEGKMSLNWVIKETPASFMISRQRVNKKGKVRSQEELVFEGKGQLRSWSDPGVKRGKYYIYRIVAREGRARRSRVVQSSPVRAK